MEFATYLTEVIFALLTTGVLIVLNVVRQYLQSKQSIELVDALQVYFFESLQQAKEEVEEEAEDTIDAIDFKNETINRAFDILMENAPKWLIEAGLTDKAITNKLKSMFKDVLQGD